MKKILDEIDCWKANELDRKIRYNINIAQNSFGEMKEQYQTRATKLAEKYKNITGEDFKI